MEPAGALAAGGGIAAAGAFRGSGAAFLAAARARLGAGERRGRGRGKLMLAYVLRRLLYALPILLGVNLFTFLLFFGVNSPDDIARMQIGAKYASAGAIERWKAERGYDKPMFFNPARDGMEKLSDTLFVDKSLRMFTFDFGRADDGRDIAREIRDRMGPSLAIALPTFALGLVAAVTFALLLVFFRATALDFWGVVLCVTMMSISGMFYIIGGQWLVAKVWLLTPISGYAGGLDMARFVTLPVLLGVVAGLGAATRWYRTIFLEEISRDYVRTARAKGLSELATLFRHVLKNALIPILTGVVVVIPSLFLGSLLMESFFAVPGLGSYTIDAIRSQDFAVVRAMVFIGSILYIAGLVLTDLSYTVVDPRVRLG
jgi:peptide/nickel transport system permease protein